MEYIKRKFNLNTKFLIFLGAFCLIILTIVFFKDGMEWIDFIGFILIPYSILSIRIAIDLAYRVGWDGKNLAYRDRGLKSFFGNKEILINVMDMTSLEGRYDGDTSMKRAFYEFDYINVRAKGLRGKKIGLHPMSLDEFRLKLVLADIYHLKPEIFSQNVIDYMNSDRDM